MARVSKRVDSKRPQRTGVAEPLFGFLPTTPVLVSCISRDGRPNIIPLIAWSFTCRYPPKMTIGICEVSYPPAYFVRASYHMIQDTGEFVINFPTVDQLDQVLATGKLSANDPGVDKFAAAGLTPGKALVVKAPTIEECPISVECVVTEHLSLGSHHLFVGEVVAYHQLGEAVQQRSHLGVDTITYHPVDGGPDRELVWCGYPQLRDVAPDGVKGHEWASIPVVSIVGHSGSGKTTLLEKLIAELQRRGHRVAVVKHHYHAGFQFDVPGKDSERFARAGADQVIVAAPDRMVSVRRLAQPPTLADTVAHIRDVDLILTEGYKQEHAPKILVSRAGPAGSSEGEQELVFPPEELIAVVTDHPSAAAVPQFGLEEIAGLADLLEARFLGGQRHKG